MTTIRTKEQEISKAEYDRWLRNFINGPSLSDRVRVFFRNLSVLHVRIAYRIITRAMRKDPDYLHSWYCNVRMPAYDAMRHNGMGHKLARHFSRHVAQRLMKHLFGQDCEDEN